RTTHVLNSHAEIIDKNQEMQVKGNRTETIKENNTETVGQHKKISVGNTLAIDAGDALELRCGASVLRMDSAGHITINGTEFSFEASGPVQITGKDVDIN
ncbi:bacteriophage T4 gp5 trimerisation domain-containing protein, partial [Morganella morganii]